MSEPATKLYRYNSRQDVVLLDAYPIVRRTPKGCWIEVAPGYPKPKLKFVLNDAVKRYAYETEDTAKTSFLRRKRRQLSILRNQIIDVEACVLAINEGRIADWPSSRYVEL